MDENIIGQRLKKRRKALGMTQGDVAKALRVSTDYVSRIEKGERTPSERVRIDIDDFIAGSGRFSARAEEGSTSTVKEPPAGYGGYIEAVAAMMSEMDEETQKDIFLSVQKEKLLRELLTERKKIG